MSGVTDLTNDGIGNALWSWSGPDPDNWGFYNPGEGDPSNFADLEAGSSRSADLSFLSQQAYVIRGVNAAQTEFQTSESNAVNFPMP
jgi:hypothetical protein